MQLIIKKEEKSSRVLAINILFSVLLIFQMILVFSRVVDIVSFGINIVIVVGGWMIFANGCSKNKGISYSGLSCIKAWSLCKIIMQGVIIIMILAGSIGMIISGVNYESSGLIIFGVLGILGGIALRTVMMIFFVKLFSFLRRSIQCIKKNERILVKLQYKVWLITMAVLEGVRLIACFTAIIIEKLVDDLPHYIAWGYEAYSEPISYPLLEAIAHYFHPAYDIVLFFTTGLTIAVCIISLFLVKKVAVVQTKPSQY